MIEFIKIIKSRPDYKKAVTKFSEFISNKDRISDMIKYYLVYDIEDNKFKMPSEYSVNYNQIALKIAIIPGKKEREEIKIQDYPYSK